MKLMIASDLHGSAGYCRAMLEALKREGSERLLLLGDLLYHGPRNDLPRDYAPKEVIALLNGVKNQLLCVRGNCEAEVDQMVLDFPVMAEYCVIFWGGRTALCYPRPPVPSGEPAAAAARRHPGTWPHPCSGVGVLWEGQPISESRFGFAPQRGECS